MWIAGVVGLFLVLAVLSPASFGSGLVLELLWFPVAYLALKGSKQIAPFSSKRIWFVFLPTAFVAGQIPYFVRGLMHLPMTAPSTMPMDLVNIFVGPLALSLVVIYFSKSNPAPPELFVANESIPTGEIEKVIPASKESTFLAVKRLSPEYVAELARLNSSVKATDFNREVRTGNLHNVTKFLNEDPLLVDITDSDGRTPLHLAYREQHQDIVDTLCAYGANQEAQDSFGKLPRNP